MNIQPSSYATVGNLRTRACLVTAVRDFFCRRNYLEIETPCRVPLPLPEAHIEPQPAGDWFLQTSPEVCMKRLLSPDLPRLFQICKAFRRNERGRRHLPEFTILEWYRTGGDYIDLMRETEDLIRFVAAALGQSECLSCRGRTIDLAPGWPRISLAEAFERHADLSLAEALARNVFDEVMGLTIEPALGLSRPVFLYDYPADPGGSLARSKSSAPELVERFELYIAGLELSNGFSELTGADRYRERFLNEQRRRQAAGRKVLPLPESFLRDIERMPEAAGNALGVDRLAMLFCDTADIKTVVAFTPETL